MDAPCQHLNCGATVEFRKIVDAEKQEQIIGREAYLQLHCKDCGIQFHFPHFTPFHERAPGVNADATLLRIVMVPGPSKTLWTVEDKDDAVPEHN